MAQLFASNLQAAMLQRESGGDYSAVNSYGYVGGYQFGAQALESIGLLKPGSSKAGNKAVNDPANWTGKNGVTSLDDFLNKPQVQDAAFQENLNFNLSVLEQNGAVNDDTPLADVSGLLAASHLLGANGAAKDLNSTDANGTTGQSYFALGATAYQNALNQQPAGPTPAAIQPAGPPTEQPRPQPAQQVASAPEDYDPLSSILANLRNPQVKQYAQKDKEADFGTSGGYSIGETFQKGMRAGAQGFGADLNYLQALASSVVGDEEGVRKNVYEAQFKEGFAADAVAGLQQFDEFIDEPTFDGFITQVSKGTGQLVPFALTSVLGAGFGAAAGVGTKIAAEGSKLAAKRIVKDSLEKTAKGIATPDEKDIANATWNLAKRARYGAYAGAGTSEFAPMSGSNFSEAIDSGEDPNDPMVAFRAAAIGVPQAAIGVGGEVALLKLIGNRAKKMSGGNAKTVMGRLAQDLGTGFLRGGAIEASTEVAQEGLSVLNRAQMDENFTAQDAQMRLGESAFAAFFGGGAFSGAGSTAAGGVRELRNVSIPDSVKQKSRELLEQGKQAITDITANEESFADGDTQFTNAEPQSDLKAQLAAMSDSGNAKAAVWVESPEPAYDAKPNGDISVKIINGEKVFVSYIAGRGTIISPYYDVVEGVRNDKASEDVLAAALGYSGTKPGDADRAVQVLDAQGRIIAEQATNEAGEADAMVALQKQMPEGGSIRVIGAEEALLNRQEKVQAEAAPVVEDVVEDQTENFADYSFEQENVYTDRLSLADAFANEGDVDTAIDLYNNVIEEGTEAQRQEAQDKINEILGNEPIVRDMNVDPVTGQTNSFIGGQSQDSMSLAPNSPSLAGQKQFENMSPQDVAARRAAARKGFAPKTYTGRRRKVRAATLADRAKDWILAVTSESPRATSTTRPLTGLQKELEAASERAEVGRRLREQARDPKNKGIVDLQETNRAFQKASATEQQVIVDDLKAAKKKLRVSQSTGTEVGLQAEAILGSDTYKNAPEDQKARIRRALETIREQSVTEDISDQVEEDLANPDSMINEQSAQLVDEKVFAAVPVGADGTLRIFGGEAEAQADFQKVFDGVYQPNWTDGGYWQRMSPFMLQALVKLRNAGKEVEIESFQQREPQLRQVKKTGKQATISNPKKEVDQTQYDTVAIETYGIKIFSTEVDIFTHQPRKEGALPERLELPEFLEKEIKLATSSKFANGSGFYIEVSGEPKPINLVDLVNTGRRLLQTRAQQEFTTGSDADGLFEALKELMSEGYKISVALDGNAPTGKKDRAGRDIRTPVTKRVDINTKGSRNQTILSELIAHDKNVERWSRDNRPTNVKGDKPKLPEFLRPIHNTTVTVSATGEKTTLRQLLAKSLTKRKTIESERLAEEKRRESLVERTAKQQNISKPINPNGPRPLTEEDAVFEAAVEQQQLAEEGIIDRPDFANDPGGNVDNVDPDRVESDEDVPYANYSVLTKPPIGAGAPQKRFNAVTFPFGEPAKLVSAAIKSATQTLQLKMPIALVAISQLQGLNQTQIAAKFGDPNVAAHFIKIARELRDNPSALGRSITYKNAHFILIDDVSATNDYEATLVAAHELGHALFQEELNELVQKPIYKKMWKSFDRRDRSVKAYDGPHGFEEWFADNVAKWADKNYKGDKRRNLESSVFKKIADKLTQMWRAVRSSLRKRFGGEVNIDVDEFIRSVVTANLRNMRVQVTDAAQTATYPTFEKKVLVRAISDEVALTAGAKELGDALKRKTVGTVKEAIRLAKPLRHVFFTANKNLRSINSRIADMFYIEAGQSARGSRMGFIQESDIQNREFEVAFEKAVGPLDSPEVIAAMEVAASESATADLNNELAKRIRGFLEDMHRNYVEPMQANYSAENKINFQQNYFPTVLNLAEVAGRPEEFKALLISQATQASRNQNTLEQRVNKAVNRIVKYQEVVTNGDLIVSEALDPNEGREQERSLTAGITRDVLAANGFLVPPSDAFRTYKKQLVKRVEWNRSTKTVTGNSRLDPMLKELPPKEASYAKDIINSYLGYGYEPMSGERRKWQSRLLAASYTLLLPLATIGSLPELAGPIIFSKEMNGFEMAFRQIKEGGMSQLEARQLAEDIGIVQDGAVSNSWISVTEREFMDESSRAWTDGFFKYTGLEWFTNFTRSFATGMAVQFLLRHASNEAGNDRSARYLKDLGVTPEQVFAWDKGGRDLTTPEGRAVKFAIQKFVESSILRPNAAERPIWASDPRWALVWQLKSYFYAFYTKIIGGIRREAVTRLGEGEGGARIAAATGILALSAVALLPLAMAGMELREYAKTGAAAVFTLGQSDKDYFRTDSMDWGTYLSEAIDKTGVYGPLAIVSMAHRSSEWNGTDAGLAALLGPTFEMIEALIGRGEFERIVPIAAVL